MIEQLINDLALQPHDSFFMASLIAYLGGLLAGLTPCVYPVMPVAVAYIGINSANSRAQSFSLSLSYVLGISLSYTSLGIFAALSGKLFGQIQSNPWTYFIMANICMLMALSMFGVFNIRMYAPKTVSRLQARKKTEGCFGSLLLGILSGFVVGPCTAPVLAVLLAYVAAKQNLIFGVLLLFLFSLGMGTLLLLIGTSTGILGRLPKSGPWMIWINRFLGLMMIAAAEYFLIVAGSFWI